MLTTFRSALVFLGFFSILLGVAYPLAMTGLGQVLFPYQAKGSLIEQDGRIVGSDLIGQQFIRPQYLHGRPSATETPYDARSSSGSNLGPSSRTLKQDVEARAQAFGPLPVPSVMATASASGLDPHITLKAAMLQVDRIAAARDIAKNRVVDSIRLGTSDPAFGILGDSIVNVLQVNIALDALKG